MTNKLTLKELHAMIEEQQAMINELKEEINELRSTKGGKRGPKSESPMTEELAWRIKFGDLKLTKNGGERTVDEIATIYGVSRGQIYSLDKYTFQHLNESSFSMDDINE